MQSCKLLGFTSVSLPQLTYLLSRGGSGARLYAAPERAAPIWQGLAVVGIFFHDSSTCRSYREQAENPTLE